METSLTPAASHQKMAEDGTGDFIRFTARRRQHSIAETPALQYSSTSY